MRLTYKHTLSGFSSSHQDLICFQDAQVPCNLCCASPNSQICFHSASHQACLCAFSDTGPGVLDNGLKGRIVARLTLKTGDERFTGDLRWTLWLALRVPLSMLSAPVFPSFLFIGPRRLPGLPPSWSTNGFDSPVTPSNPWSTNKVECFGDLQMS